MCLFICRYIKNKIRDHRNRNQNLYTSTDEPQWVTDYEAEMQTKFSLFWQYLEIGKICFWSSSYNLWRRIWYNLTWLCFDMEILLLLHHTECEGERAFPCILTEWPESILVYIEWLIGKHFSAAIWVCDDVRCCLPVGTFVCLDQQHGRDQTGCRKFYLQFPAPNCRTRWRHRRLVRNPGHGDNSKCFLYLQQQQRQLQCLWSFCWFTLFNAFYVCSFFCCFVLETTIIRIQDDLCVQREYWILDSRSVGIVI